MPWMMLEKEDHKLKICRKIDAFSRNCNWLSNTRSIWKTIFPLDSSLKNYWNNFIFQKTCRFFGLKCLNKLCSFKSLWILNCCSHSTLCGFLMTMGGHTWSCSFLVVVKDQSGHHAHSHWILKNVAVIQLSSDLFGIELADEPKRTEKCKFYS